MVLLYKDTYKINQQNIFMKKFEWLQIEAFCNGSEGLPSLLGYLLPTMPQVSTLFETFSLKD
jgi:hypothetical protein